LSEYQQLKRFIFAAREYTDRLTGIEANALVQDACEDAYKKLDSQQHRHVSQAKDMLVTHVRNLGDKGALELLAALGDYMNNGKESE